MTHHWAALPAQPTPIAAATVVPHQSNKHDADIDEFSDGLTTQDDGGESTEPEHGSSTAKMMYFGQVEEKPR